MILSLTTLETQDVVFSRNGYTLIGEWNGFKTVVSIKGDSPELEDFAKDEATKKLNDEISETVKRLAPLMGEVYKIGEPDVKGAYILDLLHRTQLVYLGYDGGLLTDNEMSVLADRVAQRVNTAIMPAIIGELCQEMQIARLNPPTVGMNVTARVAHTYHYDPDAGVEKIELRPTPDMIEPITIQAKTRGIVREVDPKAYKALIEWFEDTPDDGLQTLGKYTVDYCYIATPYTGKRLRLKSGLVITSANGGLYVHENTDHYFGESVQEFQTGLEAVLIVDLGKAGRENNNNWLVKFEAYDEPFACLSGWFDVLT